MNFVNWAYLHIYWRGILLLVVFAEWLYLLDSSLFAKVLGWTLSIEHTYTFTEEEFFSLLCLLNDCLHLIVLYLLKYWDELRQLSILTHLLNRNSSPCFVCWMTACTWLYFICQSSGLSFIIACLTVNHTEGYAKLCCIVGGHYKNL